jgi:DNA-binding NtrC family response regulator
MKVLVVDDDLAVAEVVAGMLEDLDCDVEICDGPQPSLEWLITSMRFDLALIDAALPGISGIKLAELAANENISVLLTSGQPEACETLDRFHFPHLRKPFDLDILIAEAADILRDRGENIRRVRSSAALRLLEKEERRELNHPPRPNGPRIGGSDGAG